MAATGIKTTPGVPDPGSWGKLKEGAVAVPDRGRPRCLGGGVR